MNFEKHFLNSTTDTQELIVKYNNFLKTLPQQSISEPILYVDLVYKFKWIVGNPNFSDQFKNIIKRYKKKLDITWISCDSLHACM